MHAQTSGYAVIHPFSARMGCGSKGFVCSIRAGRTGETFIKGCNERHIVIDSAACIA